jgi:hypothetical protein
MLGLFHAGSTSRSGRDATSPRASVRKRRKPRVYEASGTWARRVSNLRPLACEASTHTPSSRHPKGRAPSDCKGSRRLGRHRDDRAIRPNEGRSGHVWPNEWPNGPRAEGVGADGLITHQIEVRLLAGPSETPANRTDRHGRRARCAPAVHPGTPRVPARAMVA